jgi:hypothetical protein
MVASALLLAGALSAQPVVSAKAGLISYVEGKVYLDDHAVGITANRFPEMKESGVLRTEAGRAEVLLAPCAALRVGENSSFRMLANALTATRVELLSGSAVVDAGEMYRDAKVTLLVGKTGVTVLKKGVYRFDVAPPALKVFAGSASVERNDQTTTVGADRGLSLTEGTAPLKLTKGAADALDLWSRKRTVDQAKASGAARFQAREAQTLAAAATTAASTEASGRNPDSWVTNGRNAPPPPIFPNPARTGAYGLPGCVEPK